MANNEFSKETMQRWEDYLISSSAIVVLLEDQQNVLEGSLSEDNSPVAATADADSEVC